MTESKKKREIKQNEMIDKRGLEGKKERKKENNKEREKDKNERERKKRDRESDMNI